MGIIKCPEHGLNGWVDVCVHIWEGLVHHALPEMVTTPILGTKLCVACYEQHSVAEIGNPSLEDVLEWPDAEGEALLERLAEIRESCHCVAICVVCYQEKRLREARRNGKELPFEPYENTLGHPQRETILQLEAHIKEHFLLPLSQHPSLNAAPALIVEVGRIDKPLTIEFSYITKQEDRAFLLRLIDAFFEGIPQKQRRVRFWEAEKWSFSADGSVTNLPEESGKLLLEVLVK